MRILLADADGAHRERLLASLEPWGYQVVLAFDGHGAANVLQAGDAPALALLASGLPGRSATDICRLARDAPSPVYVLYLAARENGSELRSVLEAGADDFLYRPFDEQELKAHLRSARRILDLQQATRDAQAAFRYEARHDQLTAALNRAAILDTLRHELDRGAREHTPVGVVVIDVDDFRGLGDRHGVQAGDTVLREIMRRVSGLARTYDAVGRYATSEFLLVLPGCHASHVASLGERIRNALAATPVRLPSGPVPVTASIGTAASRAGLAADALVTEAINAARAAAAGGGNAVRAADAP